MGRYVTLAGGSDWLEGEAVLVAARAAAAEAEADQFIDAQFWGWTRTTWLTNAAPPEIDTIARKWASADYQRRNFNKASPDAGIPQYAADLFAEAKQLASDIKTRGYLIGSDGTFVYPDEAGVTGGMFPEVSR